MLRFIRLQLHRGLVLAQEDLLCVVTVDELHHHRHQTPPAELRLVPHACWVEATKRILELETLRDEMVTGDNQLVARHNQGSKDG